VITGGRLDDEIFRLAEDGTAHQARKDGSAYPQFPSSSPVVKLVKKGGIEFRICDR
jgi:hypothetical protein